ncbi:MAG: hypothetical protein U1E27_07490, partial [Kiritimatiellia bacterium]|nr:hypothetical protein [Kiritimatiellia bacterium]
RVKITAQIRIAGYPGTCGEYVWPMPLAENCSRGRCLPAGGWDPGSPISGHLRLPHLRPDLRRFPRRDDDRDYDRDYDLIHS